MILSDCFDNADALGRSLQHLRFRNHEILLFHILAPEEIEFPFKNPTKFRNIETPGHEILTDTKRLRDEYLKNFGDWRDKLKRRAEDLQIDYVPLRTDEPVDRALGHYLARRQLR